MTLDVARWAGLSISEIADILGLFSAKPYLGFTENSPNKRKYPVTGSSVGKNALLVPEVREKWSDWFELIER